MRIIWKSAVSLALVASMAAGMMLPVSAAAATGLDVENAVTLEANEWYTPLARRMAGAGVIGGQTSGYDPANPYVNVNVGVFHNVPVEVNENTKGIATYYLPDGMSPWAPAVIVMTPDHTTAKEFSNSITGLQWRAVADQNKIGVAFVEPENGGTWNLSLDPARRDDAALLDGLYQLMRKKSTKLTGAFSMDKSHTALVGYEEGGAAALLFGARWASDFSSICAVDAAAVSAASLAAVGEQYVLPFPGDSTRGVQEEAIAAKTVDTPVWFVASDEDDKTALDYYLQANQAKPAAANQAAETVYTTGREGSASEVWVSTGKRSPAAIWNQFSGQFKRFMAMQLPGRVAKTQDFTKPGFTVHEEEVNGELRRWMTYVPSTYTGDEAVPLVLVMHGYTASMYAIAEESRWYDVAEENGFIVVFAQGMVRPADALGNIPTAMWLGGAFSKLVQGADPDADLNFLDSLLDRMEADFNIDASRIYATGHSNGSMMTWTLASRFTDRLAAIAPIGAMNAPSEAIPEGKMIPAWGILGEYDGDSSLVEGNGNVKTIQGWNAVNQVNEKTVQDSTDFNGAFVTKTFSNDAGIPLMRYTMVKDTPHVYLQEESVTIWEDFFTKYSRGADGTLYYQADPSSAPVAVTAGEYQASSDWYQAKK